MTDDPDAATLKQLEEMGSDLTKEHEMEFFLIYLKKPGAKKAKELLARYGYTVRIRPTSDDRWWCKSIKKMVPDYVALMDIRRQMEDIAAKTGGEYDGWGTPIVSSSS